MIDGDDLIGIGVPEGPLVGGALQLAAQYPSNKTDDEILVQIKKVVRSPEEILEQPTDYPSAARELAKGLIKRHKRQERKEAMQPADAKPFKVYAPHLVDPNAYEQMYKAMEIPVAERGALLPDAHLGYGIPVGGVWGLRNAISPNAVGVDIGCRMSISVFDKVDPSSIEEAVTEDMRDALIDNTYFGMGTSGAGKADHEIFSDNRWDSLDYITPRLKQKAMRQLGSSGSGNHFAEIGIVDLGAETPGIEPGYYTALLTHSGSRGFGFKTAKHFKNVAEERCEGYLPDEYMNYAWLSLKSAEGQQYESAMGLAGDYAAANHDVIHNSVAEQLNTSIEWAAEHHHNYAWHEQVAQTELVVHRKGATPAGKGKVGIIPGTMADNAYIVKGTGEDSLGSLNSCSHGAGRRMSRTAAKEELSKETREKILEYQGIDLIGGGLDESPAAYKDIDEVMVEQQELVDTIGQFFPEIVRMSS